MEINTVFVSQGQHTIHRNWVTNGHLNLFWINASYRSSVHSTQETVSDSANVNVTYYVNWAIGIRLPRQNRFNIHSTVQCMDFTCYRT